jgi:hypothetical protein
MKIQKECVVTRYKDYEGKKGQLVVDS